MYSDIILKNCFKHILIKLQVTCRTIIIAISNGKLKFEKESSSYFHTKIDILRRGDLMSPNASKCIVKHNA